ncbi:MAG TPA: DUF475 domain-containing protein [Candidatus Limnocylindrales bacterium]|nr:DUF475 domain-containing protein [Candidatus Limnocylindrales bacterium]
MQNLFHSHSPFRIFAFSVLATVLTFIFIGVHLGPGALVVGLILMAVELAFSFDNAIINAKILATLSKFWQQLFLTVGILIAIFGMRVVFPILIVMLTADLSWGSVVDLALNHPKEYAEKLDVAHPSISAFGGGFLLMLALHFFMDDHREVMWIRQIEKPLMKFARWWVPAVVSVVVMGIFALLPFNAHPGETIRAGLMGIGVYLAINLFTEWLGKVAGNQEVGKRVGFAAFMTFMYLEILDASFSFDGVIGAFAITNDVILIAAGLGIGAVWVRSLTVYMVRKGTLDTYKYLEHGAHYAVFVLAATMLLSLVVHVPEVLTGVLGLGLIGASIIASRQAMNARTSGT